MTKERGKPCLTRRREKGISPDRIAAEGGDLKNSPRVTQIRTVMFSGRQRDETARVD